MPEAALLLAESAVMGDSLAVGREAHHENKASGSGMSKPPSISLAYLLLGNIARASAAQPEGAAALPGLETSRG